MGGGAGAGGGGGGGVEQVEEGWSRWRRGMWRGGAGEEEG